MTREKPEKKSNPRTRQEIIRLLKQEGSLDATALANQLGVSGMAVRQHLYALEADGLISYQEEARAVGRPAKLWQLTAAANSFFPEGYAELTLTLLRSVSEAFGDAGLEQLLEVRNQKQIAAYRNAMPANGSLQERLQVLAELRTSEGYMADLQTERADHYLLIEKHCPICTAAAACAGLCNKEIELFQAVLGEDVTIERIEHIIAGQKRCVYQITG